MKYLRTGSILLAVFILISVTFATLNANDDVSVSCLKCHGKVYDKALYNRYIHTPFLNKQCLTCHVDTFTAAQAQKRKSPTGTRPKIKWLEKHYEPAQNHYFLISKEKVDDTLYIQSKGKNRGLKTVSITLPPLDSLPQLNNDQLPPKIFDIQFDGLKRGILYSATVSWKTSEPADGQIQYGIGAFDHKTRLDNQYKVEHSITLSPLSPGKTYDYTVIAKDIYGNRAISQPLSFSSKPIDQASASVPSPPSRSNGTQVQLKPQFFSLGDKYFIQVNASQATHMKIGCNLFLRPTITMPVNDTVNLPEKHITMTDTQSQNIGACLNCHKDYKQESSHPINVRPKPGMVFPEDLPLLEDGRMHCMTCHAEHSSNYEARIRRPTKQELCIGCHNDYG